MLNFILLFVILFIVVSFLFINSLNKKKLISQSLNYKLMLIKVPKEVGDEKNEKTKKIAEMIANCDQMIANFSKYKYPIIFEVASPIGSKNINFYVSAHRKHIELVQKAITAYFPFSEVEEVEDYTVFDANNFSLGAVGKLNNNYAIPIKTYQNFESDPFAGILNAFSKIEEKEGMSLQIILQTSSNEKKVIKKIIEDLKEGKKEKDVFKKNSFEFSEVLRGMNPNGENPDKKKEEEKKVIDENLIKVVESKVSQPLFLTNVRVLISSPEKYRTDDLLNQIQGGFSQLATPVLNAIEFKKVSKNQINKLYFDYSYRLFDHKSVMVLNSSEINTFWHLPNILSEVPNINWLKARSAQAPINLPIEGIILGRSEYRGQSQLVRFKTKDRRMHTYIIGQTGTGKTVFLKNMIIQDIMDGKGVCFIDPHGDASNEILDYIPRERLNDVVYFNPADPEMSIGLNMLESDKRYPLEQTFIINELLEIMDKLYDLKTTGGPIFEQYMRNALVLLMSDPVENYTLVEIPRVLIDSDFREQLLKRSTNAIVKEFWEKEASKAEGDLALKNMAPYINSKLSPFLTNDIVRPIIGQKISSLNFKEIINTKKIFIVNLAKGVLGDINSYLLGMIIIGRLSLSAFARIEIPEEERQDFYLYIDEFQNITTKTIPQILSEARKFRLGLILAHQFVAQVKEDIRDSIFGNVGTMVSFRVSSQDGETLQKYFSPVFAMQDLVNLDNYNACIRLMIDGQPAKAFNIKNIKPEEATDSIKEEVKKASNDKYARPRKEVDEEIMARFKMESAKTEESEEDNSDDDFLDSILKSVEEKNINKENE